jgi:UDP-2-acetamido-2-deoxy-ribo-hexuluronate aminotransferase
MNIEMVDLKGQYHKIKSEIDRAIFECMESAEFINGKKVAEFTLNLAQYTGAKYVIPCANGTDALQIALMALNLVPGDEVIIPTYTYIATAEVIALLGLEPVLVDVHAGDFTINTDEVTKAITPRTKAIIPVHLFGQCANMNEIMALAEAHHIFVIEDAAQAIGAKYTFRDGITKQAGTIGDIGTTSFFPSKNLGCYGDGGAIFTNDDQLAGKIKMIANHGQSQKYHHDIVGVNSRLDTIQAAILNVKLKHLDAYTQARINAAHYYDLNLSGIENIIIPERSDRSTHVFHQYTIKVKDDRRNSLKEHLKMFHIPSMIYYPVPVHLQKAYYRNEYPAGRFPVAEKLSDDLLSLPMHSELTTEEQAFIIKTISDFFMNKN